MCGVRRQVRRVPLEQLIMRMKSLRLPGKAVEIASELPEPPLRTAVEASVAELTGLGALHDDEQLTPLGELLATLPIDPRLGKLIVLGSLFGATDEALTVAAGLTSRSPFLSPLDRRGDADRSRKAFADGTQSVCGRRSNSGPTDAVGTSCHGSTNAVCSCLCLCLCSWLRSRRTTLRCCMRTASSIHTAAQ